MLSVRLKFSLMSLGDWLFGMMPMPALLTSTSRRPYLDLIYSTALRTASSFVISSSTTSSDEVMPSFRSSEMAVSPEAWERQARMYVADGLRRAVACMMENPIPQFAPVTSIT